MSELGNLPQQQTLEQKRAAQAWSDVTNVPAGAAKKYGTIVRKFASLIQTNGLGQTLAFLKSKSENDQGMKSLYGHMSTWVTGRMEIEGDLLQAIMAWSSDDYRRATSETLAYAIWLRRFAEANGMVDETGDD